MLTIDVLKNAVSVTSQGNVFSGK